MVKKIITVLVLLVIVTYVLIYFEQYSLNKFSIVNITIERNDQNYMLVKNATELEKALLNPKIEIIEIMNNIDLGYNVIKNNIISSDIFEEHNEPLTHPKLKKTGISKLKIENKENLILYSNNGSSILHCNIKIENSNNIKISNLKFGELWEWDEDGKGEYDRNDWDNITIKNSQNVCISNCEFSKSYDGITDIKDSKNITIENCKLDSININDDFFDEQFKYLENNKDKYEMYRFLRDDIELSYEEVKELFSYQFKGFLIENNEKNSNIIIHDCLFLNVKTRFPLIRKGMAYIYNIYADSRNLSNMMDKLIKDYKFDKIKEKYNKVVSLNSYGVIAEENAYVFAKNTVFDGAKYPYVEYQKKENSEKIGKIIVYNERNKTINLRNYLEEIAGVKSENK